MKFVVNYIYNKNGIELKINYSNSEYNQLQTVWINEKTLKLRFIIAIAAFLDRI